MLNSELTPATSNRVTRCLALRTLETGTDAFTVAPAQTDNGDEALYADKSGTYTKGVLQSGVGLVDVAAYQSFKSALSSGAPTDFEQIVLGGPRTLNGPQGGLAFYLDCQDSSQFAVPPAPALASEAYATELVELYWASLLRDVAFTAYPANGTAAQAAAELSAMPAYAGPRNSAGQVTPELLFRGRFAGETTGPYVSQFLLHQTALGSLPIVQKYITNEAGTDFMTMADEFLKVQNGVDTGKRLTPGAALYLHDGRGLAAYTHDDVLYQAYLSAYLALNTINAPLNPGNPYIDPGGLLATRRARCSIRAVLMVMVLCCGRSFPSSRPQNGCVMSMQPVPWPEPDPQIAAAIKAMYGSRKTERPLAVEIRDRLGQWLADEDFAAAFGDRAGRAGPRRGWRW